MDDAPDVFAYLDHRAFLREYYAFKKATGAFSFRTFSRRAGLTSPNYLKLVMDGERNLSEPMAPRFAEACRLEGEAAEFFVDLVHFGQSRNGASRLHWLRRLQSYARHRKIHRLRVDQLKYYEHWYLPAIRELVLSGDFQEDPSWIAGRLLPPIRKEQAERAIRLLAELELVARDEDGKLVVGTPVVDSGDDVESAHLVAFYRAMLERASESLSLVPHTRREFGSVTLCIEESRIAELKQRVRRFRAELLDLSAAEEAPSTVVHVGIQLFPLTKQEIPS